MTFKQATTHNFLVGNRECNTERGFKKPTVYRTGVDLKKTKLLFRH